MKKVLFLSLGMILMLTGCGAGATNTMSCSYEVKNGFILNNKFVKTFGMIGILATLIAVPVGFVKFICGSEYINTLLFYQMFFVFI